MSKSSAKLLPLKFNFPNTFTAIRLVLTIVIAFLMILGTPISVLIAGLFLILAWISDGLDGYLARKLGQATLSGAIFDIVVDRLLMGTILVLSIVLGYWRRTSGLMPFTLILMLCRFWRLISPYCWELLSSLSNQDPGLSFSQFPLLSPAAPFQFKWRLWW